ncbi:MAG: hypothetical protein LBD27_05035 [Tannerella sp.]|jgi:hypothetical protein|nr:hypothetical protein [Tannerella sp.]
MEKMSIEKRIFAAIICIAAVLVAIPARTGAQELSVGGDLVSSYVWRGAYCGGVSIQPTLSFSAGGFSLTAWGSVGFTSPAYLEEFDFTAGYSVGGLSLAITDYWFVFRAVDNSEDLPDYFNYKDGETAHMFEGSAAYDFGPLALAWNTFFAGADVNSKGKRAYSTYIEASAPFKVGAFGLKAELGITPWDGLYADKFNVANIGITGSKEIKVTDSFGIPAFTKVIFNPAAKQTHFVFGISL